jgi:outer membrane lipoprotein-sorting protein
MRRPFLFALLLGIAPALVGPVRAAAPGADAARSAQDLQALLHRVEARYRALPSFTVPFTQRYTSATFGARDEARGTLHVVPPSRMLWLYDVPQGQRGALDGDSYWLIDPEERQVTVRARGTGGSDPLTDLLSGRLDLGKVFAAEPLPRGETRGRTLLQLLPRTPRDDMERAVLEVDEKDGTVRRLDVEDPLGNRFEYFLGAPVAAPAPPAAAFKLVVPPGYAESRD